MAKSSNDCPAKLLEPVYLLACKLYGTLYIGVTKDLVRRVYEHKEGIAESFTRKYGVTMLVYFEQYGSIDLAIEREKKLKKWERDWKIALIEKDNAEWRGLYETLL